MRVTAIIRFLIAIFGVLAATNILFTILTDRASEEIAEAYEKRESLMSAIEDYRTMSDALVRYTRIHVSRAYISTWDRGVPYRAYMRIMGHDRRMENALRAFELYEVPENEMEMLLRAEGISTRIREMESAAFESVRMDYPLQAMNLAFGASYEIFITALDHALDELQQHLVERTENMVNEARRQAAVLQGMSFFVTILFAAVSVLGTLFLLRRVKEANKQTSEAEEVQEKIADALPILMEFWDKDGNIIDCNRQTYETFGFEKKEDYLKNHASCTPEFQPDGMSSRNKIRGFVKKALSEGAVRTEWLDVLPTGEELPTEIHFVSLILRGEPTVVSFSHDLREVKRRELAEEESRAKTKFLARMSHEIRTPMNAVLGITEIQLQKGNHPPETEDALLRIHSSSTLLLSIINDILDLSKVEAGKMELLDTPYDMASLIMDTIVLNLMHIGGKNIEFKLEIDESLPATLMGDVFRIKQILNNFLSNSFKYTDEGLVTLEVGKEESPDGLVVVFCVKDTGQGMTEEQIESLFSAEFTRFNIEANRVIEGTGLGMSIAKQLLSMMNGTVSVESEPGKGSVFTIRIPQRADGPQVLGKESADNLRSLRANYDIAGSAIAYEPMPYGRVLAVDDLESNLYVVEGYLKPYKVAVETVLSGREAVARVKAGEVYDIIFMDHMMPDMDGVEATKIIRGIGYQHPIIALTANTVKGAVELFMSNGFTGFISKPIDSNQLNTQLLKYIRDKQPPEALEAAKAQSGKDEGGEQGNRLVESFLRDAKKAEGLLEPILRRREFGESDLRTFIIQVHGLKSALSNVGKPSLSDVARALEDAGRRSDIGAILALSPSFLENLKAVIEEMSPEAAADAFDEAPALLLTQLGVFAYACDNYNKRGATDALKPLRRLTWSNQTKDLIEELDTMLLHSEFEEAAELARSRRAEDGGHGLA